MSTVQPTRSASRFARVRPVAHAVLLAAALALGVGSSPALGVTRTWTGLGPTNNWMDAANWSGNVVPGAADVASFDGTSAKPATINAAISISGLTIAATIESGITQWRAAT